MSDQKQNESHPFHREGDAVVFDKLESTEEIARKRREDEQHGFARQQVKTNNRLAWLTALLVLGTFCGTVIGIWQSRISQKAANAAASAASTAEKTLAETQRSNQAQNLASKDALRSAISNFDLDQRAWVGISDVKLMQLQANQPITVSVTAVNSGRTIAMDVRLISTTHVSDIPVNIANYAQHPLEKNVRPITIGQKQIAIFDWFPNISMTLPSATGPADALVVANIKNGTKYLYAFGEIHYRDVFKRPHTTLYCALWVQEINAFAPCDSYNYAD